MKSRSVTTKRWINGRVTWRSFQQTTEALASQLIAFGLNAGDRVAIFANNSAQWSCADVATLMARGVVVPIYPTSHDQLKHIMQDGVGIVSVDNATIHQVLELEARACVFKAWWCLMLKSLYRSHITLI